MLSNKMNNGKADGHDYIALPLFFFSWIIFSTQFSMLSKKNEENLSIISLIFFFKKHHQIPFYLALCLKTSLKLKFCKNGNI